MNAIIDSIANSAGIIGLFGAAEAVRQSNHFTSNPDRPVPLWLTARVRAVEFMRDDLEQTHWKKIWR